MLRKVLGMAVLACAAFAEDAKPRVFISDSNSWEMSGGFAGYRDGATGNAAAGGKFSGGARPQTVELIKTFGERCPSVTVTMNRTHADFVVLFDREGGKGIAQKKDKIAVFKRSGDVLYSGSTRSVGNAVKDSCGAITAQAPLSSLR